MKLFISWSGPRSQQLAESLRNWIPKVINAVDPWVSANDIDPGSRWSTEIAGQLEGTQFGIICLTVDNLKSPWLHFEAGALSKLVDKSKVAPLLLDNNPVDIQGPLSQFQSVKVSKDDIRKLMNSINIAVSAVGEKGIDKTDLDEIFDVWWPRLETNLNNIPKSVQKTEESKRSEREMIEEILELVRSMARDSSWESTRLIIPIFSTLATGKYSEEFRSNLTKLLNTSMHGGKSNLGDIAKLYYWLNTAESSTTKPSSTKTLEAKTEEKPEHSDENADDDNQVSDPIPRS